MKKRTLVMAVLDGWGVGNHDSSNPIYLAKPEQINFIKQIYPTGTLKASGIAVGLPWGSSGDSEVGHLTLGAGKVLYQNFPRISISIKNKSFFKNDVIKSAIAHTKKNGSNLHIAGLIGEKNVHSSLDHLRALIDFANNEGISNFYLHLFTDGRDSGPQKAAEIIKKFPEKQIASVSGRYFAMDNDLHWERTKRVYDVMTGKIAAVEINGINSFLDKFYERGMTDESINPTLIAKDGYIKENDSVIFFNFREDGMRQLAEMFTNPEAGERHSVPNNIFLASFTKYSEKIRIPAAFPREKVENPLGKVLSDKGLVQLRIAETEKYAHVTYFFNGLTESPFKNEYRVLIPSRSSAKPDEHPEMMAQQITERVVSAVEEGIYDFILVNYANPDAMGHTGNIDAAISAIKTVDNQIGILRKALWDNGGILVITSDHGNVEKMFDQSTGLEQTTHEKNSVPIYVITKGYEKQKNEDTIRQIESSTTGVLSDVAPTVLELLGIQKPKEMTGISLLQSLR